MQEYFSIFLESQAHKRELKISKDKVIENENKTISSKELLKIFDPEQYKKYRNKSLSGKMIKTLERTVNQFYVDVKKVKDPKDKRKTLYALGKLYNHDGSPIERVNNRKKIDEFSFLFRVLLIKILYNYSTNINSNKLINWLNEFGFINQKYLNDYYDINNKDKIYNDEHITIKELKNEGIISTYTSVIKDENERLIESTEIENNKAIIEKIEMSDKKAISLLNNYYNKLTSKLLYSLISTFEYLYEANLIDYDVEYIGELLVSKDKNYPIFEDSILTGNEIQQYISIKELIKTQLEKEGTYKFYNEKKYIKRLNEYIYNKGIETAMGVKYFKKISIIYKVNSKINDRTLKDFLRENSEFRELLLEDNVKLIQKYKDLLISSIIKRNSNKFGSLNEELENMIEGSFGDTEDLFDNDMQRILNFKLMMDELEIISTKLLNDRHSNNLDNKLSNLNSILND